VKKRNIYKRRKPNLVVDRMYKRHNIWDEDKWNIHSNSGSGYAAGHGKSGAGYASSGNPVEHYHKIQMYGSKEGDKTKDLYKSNEAQEEDKKKKEKERGKTLADAVQQEQKYQKKPETAEDGNQKRIASAPQTDSDPHGEHKPDEGAKKHNKTSIEEAISDAIKEEKETIHLD